MTDPWRPAPVHNGGIALTMEAQTKGGQGPLSTQQGPLSTVTRSPKYSGHDPLST